MAQLAQLLKSEITRLSAKQSRSELAVARRQIVQHRRDIAVLKRVVTDLQRRVAFLEKREKQRLVQEPVSKGREGVRFSAKWLRSHRAKLGLSAAKYGNLVGVTGLTIYNWEHGKSKPRAQQLSKIAAVRGIGRRDALRRLQMQAAA